MDPQTISLAVAFLSPYLDKTAEAAAKKSVRICTTKLKLASARYPLQKQHWMTYKRRLMTRTFRLSYESNLRS